MRFILPKEFIVSLSVSLLIGWWFFVFVIHIQNTIGNTQTWYFRKLYMEHYTHSVLPKPTNKLLSNAMRY